jgi:hypothetical protein
MSAIAAEYQEVFQLYLRLGKELTKIMGIDDAKNPQFFVESILANRDYMTRIEQLNSRVLQLSEDWERYRTSVDLEAEDQIRELAAAARAQAVRLKELCSIHAQKLQIIRDKLEKDLAEIGKGTEYLKSVKPIKNNYPKFIDSLY